MVRSFDLWLDGGGCSEGTDVIGCQLQLREGYLKCVRRNFRILVRKIGGEAHLDCRQPHWIESNSLCSPVARRFAEWGVV